MKLDIHSNVFKKTILIAIISVVLIGAIIGVSFGIVYGVVNKDEINIKIDENVTYQTFEGFGASSAWIYRSLGRDASEEVRQEIIDSLYSEDGLGLNIFRFNLGAGSEELEGLPYDWGRVTDSFFMSENYVDYSSFANEANYDFTKDPYAVSAMMETIEKGSIKKLVIFSNSPHYLLTKNGKTHGTNEKENNLKEDAYGAFSDYVLICAKGIRQMLIDSGHGDIEIYLSPVNEPQWKWGGETASQEGCHYDPDVLAKFYQVFYEKLTAFNSVNDTNFVMDIYESGNYKLGLNGSKNKKYLNEFSKYEFFKHIDELSVHSYAADDSASIRSDFMKFMSKNYSDKKIVMSEYCVMQGGVDESVEMGLLSSKVLLRDLKTLNVSEWSWWLGVACGGWEDGLVYWNTETNEITKYYRYYMYKNFMQYIKEGDVHVEASIYDPFDWGGIDCVAFKKPDGRLVLVVLNDSDRLREINLKGLDGYTSIKRNTTAKNIYNEETEEGFWNTLEIEPKSVTTFVFSN